MSHVTRMLRGFTVLGLAFAAAGPLSAQNGLDPRTDPDRAARLKEKAVSIWSNPKRYEDAADLLVRASRLRAADDPQAVKDLVMAMRMYAHAGRADRARATAQKAAERALDFGDVVAAANSHLDAALLAIDANNTTAARTHAANAARLARSPQLGEADRQEIMTRLAPAHVALRVAQ